MNLIIRLAIRYGLHLSWLIVLLGIVGSLYFSEIRNFPPCLLCWYQRIAFYPLAIILLLGILAKDERSAAFYSLGLIIVGFGISAYHNLMYFDLLKETEPFCINGISCVERYTSVFGLDIPQMSLAAKGAIMILLFARLRYGREND